MAYNVLCGRLLWTQGGGVRGPTLRPRRVMYSAAPPPHCRCVLGHMFLTFKVAMSRKPNTADKLTCTAVVGRISYRKISTQTATSAAVECIAAVVVAVEVEGVLALVSVSLQEHY